jgi:hypothetical protein
MVVEQVIPHRTYADRNHDKIFIDPKRRFLFALAGNFDPAVMSSPEVMDFVEALLLKCIKMRALDNGRKYSLIKEEDILNGFLEYFKKDADVFLVTNQHRYIILKMDDAVAVQNIGDCYGSGTGGLVAVGMFRGGMPIEDIWVHLNRLVDTSSVEHTIIPLSILTEDFVV